MKEIGELRRSIRLLIKYPHSFTYLDFGDRGNVCAKNLDRMTTDENIDYAESYAAVLVAMPKYSELHKHFAPVLATELGVKRLKYDYIVKLLARILGDDSMKSSKTVEKMCLFTSRVQKYMKDNDKTELTTMDLANF